MKRGRKFGWIAGACVAAVLAAGIGLRSPPIETVNGLLRTRVTASTPGTSSRFGMCSWS